MIKKICLDCKNEIPEDSNFCPFCGGNNIDTIEDRPELVKPICPKCEIEIPDDSEFCPYCGTKIKPIINKKEDAEIKQEFGKTVEREPKRVINPPNTGLPIAIKFLLTFICAILVTVLIAVIYILLA